MITMTPALRQIVTTIADDFGGKEMGYAARPYLDALLEVIDGEATYHADTVDTLLRYLRGNLAAWRGPLARSTKAQLDALLTLDRKASR